MKDFTVNVTAAKITVTGTDYEAWNLIAGDSLFGVNITTKKAVKPINDDAALKELQIRCIGGEGINLLAMMLVSYILCRSSLMQMVGQYLR